MQFGASYEPFGQAWDESGPLAGTERYRFLGERHDLESGLVYLRARQYDPGTGRFTALDPVLGALGAPQTLNRFPYVANNPARYTDPTGDIPPLILIGAALLGLGAIGVGVGIASHYVPAIRPYTDAFADVFGLVPLYGDAFSLGYYYAQGALDCAAGPCDRARIGINLGASIPILGDLAKVLKYGGAGVGVLGIVAKGARAGDLGGFGFTSFRAWKRAMGDYPWRWHHIVEQTPWNKAKFGDEMLHNINNMILVQKSFHKRISKFYQSIQPFTGGKTFRQFLMDKSFEEQLAWGWWAIRYLGG